MMNKQEVDSLIENNSVRMTNRDWLESLSDEEFLDGVSFMYNTDGICGIRTPKECGKLDCGECRLAWLRSEHKESDNG